MVTKFIIPTLRTDATEQGGEVTSLVIRNEQDAYELLSRCIKPDFEIGNDINVVLDGWPTLEIRVKGERFNSTITPSIMAGFIEFQKAIYKSYALTKYNSSNVNKLTKDEKEQLELLITVSEGSSIFGIDFQGALEKFMDNVGNKLTRKDVVVSVLALGVLYFGDSAYKSYLEERREVRVAELKSEEQVKMIEHLQFASEEETKRAKIIQELAQQHVQVQNVQSQAHDAQTELVKSFRRVEKASIGAVTVDGETATELTKNARKKSLEVRLDGAYRVMLVDSSELGVFKIKVRDILSKEEFTAIVQDESMDHKHKRLIQAAEWSKTPVNLVINAKDLDGEIKQAVVMSASEYTTKTAN